MILPSNACEAFFYNIKLCTQWGEQHRYEETKRRPTKRTGNTNLCGDHNHCNIKYVFLWILHHLLKSISLRFCKHLGARRRCSDKGKKSCFILVRPSALMTTDFLLNRTGKTGQDLLKLVQILYRGQWLWRFNQGLMPIGIVWSPPAICSRASIILL